MTEEMNTTEIGNVQWFDQKKGFGFLKITTPNSDFNGKEIFVHYSNIESQSQFKKLFPGENVSLNVVKNPDETSNKEYISQNVRGLYGSPLMIDNEGYVFRVIRKRNTQEVTTA